MWHALKTELSYSTPWLLGGLGIATFVSTLLIVLTVFVNESDGVPGFVVGMFPVIAGMVVAFIAQGYRSEERRARLLLAGPMTPQQLAVLTVLLPSFLVGIGVLYGALLVAVTTVLVGVGALEGASVPSLGVFSVQFLAYAQMGPLAQESTAARRQYRGTAAVIGWAVFAGAVLCLAASQFLLESTYAPAMLAAVIATVMIVAAVLYTGRTDFTR